VRTHLRTYRLRAKSVGLLLSPMKSHVVRASILRTYHLQPLVFPSSRAGVVGGF
jgi:hypothetical protein